ncbi:multidrug efflux pump subunit AcrB [Bradyrhizobium sp. USDA 4369]
MRRLNISAWAVRQPIPPVLLFLVLTVFGIAAFLSLPVTRLPTIEFPAVMVTITQGGAASQDLEIQVSKKVEDAIAALPGIKRVSSTITDGMTATIAEFRVGVNADRAVNDVKDVLARLRAELPRTIDEPICQRIDVEGLPIAIYAASAPSMSVQELSWFIDNVLGGKLQKVPGVAKVERIGGGAREIRVSLSAEKLESLSITAGDVSRQLRATNIDVSGGRSELGGSEQAIRTLGASSTVEGLAALPVVLPGGRKIRLDQLGAVTDGVQEARKFARLNGETVVGFVVLRAKGSSDTDVASHVAAVLAEISAKDPKIAFDLIDTSVSYTRANYLSAMHALGEGAVLAVIIVFIFLRDFRATVIAAIALPLSIIPTFWFMKLMGFSLNIVTLLGLTLVTGVLVDDAIVEIENIIRHVRSGKAPVRASIEATDEIGFAVIAISLTLAAIFLPVSFMGGVAGQYFRQFGLTVAAAVMFSLLVARLITPLLAAHFVRASRLYEGGSVMIALYLRTLTWCVRHRFKTISLGCALLICSFAGVGLLPQGYMPTTDAARVMFAIELPPGATLGDTQVITDQAMSKIRRRPEVKNVFVVGGEILGSVGGGAEVRKATLIVSLVPSSERKSSQADMERAMIDDLAEMPDIRSWLVREDGDRAVMFQVLGVDSAAVTEVAADLAIEMKHLPMLANVQATAALRRPELQVRPRPELAAELGVATETLSEVMRIATIGDVDTNLARFNLGDRQLTIRVHLDEAARGSRETLELLKVATASGKAVPIAAVADIGFGQGPATIERYDRHRTVMVSADLADGYSLGEAIDAVKALAGVRGAPSGITVKEVGDAELMQEVFSSFAAAMASGLLLVYVVLVLLFLSFFQPLTIMASIPMSLTGVVVALCVAHQPIGLPVVIGILMLMGVVSKNAIMLVDVAVEEIAKGTPSVQAVIEAGKRRARPIVMTTLAMVGGMVPSALGLGGGGEFRSPMAVAVIGGLLASTVLSLLFVPVGFLAMESALARVRRSTYRWGSRR